MGANRRYIVETIPHIASLMRERCEDVIRLSEVIVVGLREHSVLQALYADTRADHTIIDLVNVPARQALKGTYRGVCW